MKQQKPCAHLWSDIYEFTSTNGERFLQQQCDYCKTMRYVPLGKSSENDQNGSESTKK